MGRWLIRFLLVAAVLLFTGLFWWLPAALVRPALALTAHKARPDYYIDRPHLTAMNHRGRPRYILTAKRLLHFARRKRSILIHPHLVQFGRRTITTTVARRGYISPHGHTLILRGRVRVFRGPTAHIGNTTVRTRTLTVQLTS